MNAVSMQTFGEMVAALDLLRKYTPSMFWGCQTMESVDLLERGLMGRGSILMGVMMSMPCLLSENRKYIGERVNEAKAFIELKAKESRERLGAPSA